MTDVRINDKVKFDFTGPNLAAQQAYKRAQVALALLDAKKKAAAAAEANKASTQDQDEADGEKDQGTKRKSCDDSTTSVDLTALKTTLNKKKVAELRKELEDKSLDTKGTKPVLVQRLLDAAASS